MLLVPNDPQHLEPELLSEIRAAERFPRQRGAGLDDDLAQVRAHAELFGQPGGRAAVRDEAAREEHVNKPDHGDWNTDRRELEHAHRRQAIGADHATDDHVRGGADQRDGTGDDRRKRERHEEPGRSDAGLFRDAENHRQKERGRSGVAHERADAGRGDHDDPKQPIGIGARVAQHRPPGQLDHTSALERRGEDEQTKDHYDRIAAKTRERFFRRQQPGEGEREQQTERDDFRRDALPPKQRESQPEKAEQEKNLGRHDRADT